MEKWKLEEDSKSPENRNKLIVYPSSLRTKDPHEILSLFFDILRQYNVPKTENENCILYSKAEQSCVDMNNNSTQEHCFQLEDNNNYCFDDRKKIDLSTISIKSKNKFKPEVEKNGVSDCSCICDARCPNHIYRQISEKCSCCCNQDFEGQIKENEELKCGPCSEYARPIQSAVAKISSSIKQTFNEMHLNRSNVGKSSQKGSSIMKCRELPAEEMFSDSMKRRNDCIMNNCYEDNFTSGIELNPMLITKNQGLLEVHIVRLQLSKTGTRLLHQDNAFWNASFFISWDIQGQKTAFTPVLKYPSLNFDSSSIYFISELLDFLDYIFEEYITFQVHVLYPNENTHTIAQTKLCIQEVLDYPHNKMQYITPVNSLIPCSLGANFGQLSLWVRLSCDLAKTKAFKEKRRRVSDEIYYDRVSPKNSTPDFKKEKDSSKDYLDEKLGNEDQEGLKNLSEKIVSENKVLDLGQKSIFLNAIEDIDNLEGREQKLNHGKITKDSSEQIETEDIQKFNKMISNVEKSDVIVITVISISLFEGCSIFRNKKIKQLYVEYSFLGNSGEGMETESIHIPKSPNSEMIFNFTREFQIDKEKHPQQRLMFYEMLNEIINPIIEFTIVSEPLDEEIDEECEEVGFAQLDLRESINHTLHRNLLIMNHDKTESLGILKIFVDVIERSDYE